MTDLKAYQKPHWKDFDADVLLVGANEYRTESCHFVLLIKFPKRNLTFGKKMAI